MPGFRYSFCNLFRPSSARPEQNNLHPKSRILSFHIKSTHHVLARSTDQLPSPTPQERQAQSPVESTLLYLLYTTSYLLDCIRFMVDAPHTSLHDLSSQVPNSDPGPDIQDLHHALSDLSWCLAHFASCSTIGYPSPTSPCLPLLHLT